MKVVHLDKKYYRVSKANSVVENVVFYADPGVDRALMIVGKNVTVRNVIIHHSSSGMGIYAFKAKDLLIENVEIKAYGTERGENPCPLTRP